MRKLHSAIEESRKKYGIENNYESFFNLGEDGRSIGNSDWEYGSITPQTLERFELWRRALMSGKLEKGMRLMSVYYFRIKPRIYKEEKIKAMFNEVDLKVGDVHQELNMGMGGGSVYHIDYDAVAVFTTIDKLPEHLKKQRRELIFRRVQASRAIGLLGKLAHSIALSIPNRQCDKWKDYGWESFLENPPKKMEEVNELLLESNPSRLNDDLTRYTENLYDFLGVPIDTRKKDYQITLHA